ncbi:uncharacterized protein LOC130728606 [Lotus japonicus]|uniref:uncharacterized protein LOC130728606 n=1 Tax=Lotus japonicus TaxID=34305 RepID=UPI00258F96D3|nr:uncharacterized protein LOC130728606 [Lotus japonicus]XP_057436111.1 uncharacterized protein LOC130728606 [Lotus japonicus]XP_057436118.1 uncharacterized protein LOC130728606 [Lotus japonicus]XP_057436126.1 uncharacterized protein LOC130728606 [Lotus japonicus]XP_057436134.1 uncharacterized protein LOC130728606 [Lotus japonicus]XP_057436143.1 uncharacterized protein LOC130728606 [Lotus japonicus]XP_057436149.1 uncharacterized protein LOC130728606 [Lotus japonicus]XP_057436154.1 uncharacte
MGDDDSVSLDNFRANWTPSQDQYFLELMLSHVHRGNKTGKVFSRRAWADMIEQFNTTFGLKYDIDVLKNRFKRFRKQYIEIKTIISQKGFQWDNALNMIVAGEKTWDEYIKDHPSARAFRTRVVPYYNDMCIIYGHAVADGRYSLSCFDVDFEYEDIASKELDDQTTPSKGVDDQTPPTVINQSKIDWSPMMDHFFVELMVDQVRKGNKIGRSFDKKAWVDMTESFNDRFESHYCKVVLKNRLNVLRRHYCSINALLGKEGFSWDKRQQKVVADDQVWQKCIRVNHNFRLYRIKSMPFYSGMCIICRDEATAGCRSNLEKESPIGEKSVPDTEPLPYADKGALHIGAENNCTRDTHHLANADKGALHIGAENNFTRDNQHLANAYKEALHIGAETNCTRDTEPLANADREALHIGSEKNSPRETQPRANANNEALHIGGEKNSSRETQPLANADNDPLLSHGGKNASGHKKRHEPKMPPILNEAKKARKYDESMDAALKRMAAAVKSQSKKTKKEDNFSVDNVISVLQAMPDLDEDLILDACDFLEDERRARMFLALDANLRKKWLLRKLRS